MSVLRVVAQRQDYLDQKHEDFRLRTRSSQGGPDQVYSVNYVCGMSQDDASNLGPCWYIQRTESQPNSTQEVGGGDIFPYRIARDQSTYFNGQGYAYWHSQPVTIGRRAYGDVLEVNSTYIGHYDWAPGLGIVRQRVKVRFVPHTRTLLRSHIVQ